LERDREENKRAKENETRKKNKKRKELEHYRGIVKISPLELFFF